MARFQPEGDEIFFGTKLFREFGTNLIKGIKTQEKSKKTQKKEQNSGKTNKTQEKGTKLTKLQVQGGGGVAPLPPPYGRP